MATVNDGFVSNIDSTLRNAALVSFHGYCSTLGDEVKEGGYDTGNQQKMDHCPVGQVFDQSILSLMHWTMVQSELAFLEQSELVP